MFDPSKHNYCEKLMKPLPDGPPCWGDWVFNSHNLTLSHSTMSYEIDLERIHSSAAILDWIFQIQGKGWASAETMHDLLRAFKAILNPQTTFCSNEEDLRADGGELARAFAATWGRS